MSATGTRPPLFDPEPEGFDGEGAARQQFPRRRASGGSGYPKNRSTGGSSSPRWVRPFIFGGLVLIALVSLVSILTGGGSETGDQVAPAPDDDVAAQGTVDLDADAADPAIDPAPTDPQAGDADAGTAGADAADADPTGDADPTVEQAGQTAPATGDGTADADLATPTGQAGWSAEDLQAASAFSVQFAHDYLNYDQAQPAVRERDLRAYLAPGLDPQLGWNGQGTQLAVLTIPIQTTADDDGVVVTVAAQVTGQDAPRWVHLAVPLAQDDAGRWAVTAQPAYVPRPAAGNPTLEGPSDVDQALSNELIPSMTELFTAYAAEGSVAVGGVTAPGATIRGLQGQVTFAEIDAVRIATGADDTREGMVTVTWDDPVTGGAITQDYDVVLTASDGGWLVEQVTHR